MISRKCPLSEYLQQMENKTMAKILVIDDSGFQRKSICSIVKKLGHETFEAINGKEGLKTLEDSRFDFIICDLLMPEVDGFGVLEALKENSDTTPIIILTADRQTTSSARAIDLGALDVLNKPPKAEEIENLLQKHMKVA